MEPIRSYLTEPWRSSTTLLAESGPESQWNLGLDVTHYVIRALPTKTRTPALPTPPLEAPPPKASAEGVAEEVAVAREPDPGQAPEPDNQLPNNLHHRILRVFEVGVPCPAALPEGGCGAQANSVWPSLHKPPTRTGRTKCQTTTTTSCRQWYKVYKP